MSQQSVGDGGAVPKKAASARKRTPSRAQTGNSAAQEQAVKSVDEATEPIDENGLPEDRDEWFRAPGFQRMKTAWDGPDKAMLQRVTGAVNERIWDLFPDVLEIMNEIYDVVRKPTANPVTGEELLDAFGFKIWEKNPLTGGYIEDWTLLDNRQKEHFIYRIATQIVEWEMISSDLWIEAMMSKGMFTERFSIEFDAPTQGTVDDRTARGNKEAAEDRYFAIMNAAISRKAEGLVRSMNNLMLRLRDTLDR